MATWPSLIPRFATLRSLDDFPGAGAAGGACGAALVDGETGFPALVGPAGDSGGFCTEPAWACSPKVAKFHSPCAFLTNSICGRSSVNDLTSTSLRNRGQNFTETASFSAVANGRPVSNRLSSAITGFDTWNDSGRRLRRISPNDTWRPNFFSSSAWILRWY